MGSWGHPITFGSLCVEDQSHIPIPSPDTQQNPKQSRLGNLGAFYRLVDCIGLHDSYKLRVESPMARHRLSVHEYGEPSTSAILALSDFVVVHTMGNCGDTGCRSRSHSCLSGCRSRL